MKIEPINNNNNDAGFTLLEVMLAIFFLTVGIGGAFMVIQKTVGLSSVSVSRLVAANLAQEGIEIVRNIRDTNWLEGEDWDKDIGGAIETTTYHEADYNDTALSLWVDPGTNLNYDDDGFYSYNSVTNPTKFKRKITISKDADADKLKVTVIVEWQERGATHNFTAQEYLYNWK